MADFVTVLTDDHRRVEQLFNQYEQTGDPAAAQQAFFELTVHSMVEEELLYGLYSAKVDNAGAAEARREHQDAKDLILALEGLEPGSDAFASTMAELMKSVRHHVEEEEHEMFPKILEAIPDTASTLGNDIVARKEVVQKQVWADRQVGMDPSTASQKPTASPEPGW